MADAIFDHPETGGEERHACHLLCAYLAEQGFAVETGVGGLETSFRAVYEYGNGGPSIGLLCEYDALAGFGHGCAHHLQGPAIVAAAKAVKDVCMDNPFKLVVYGTPDEEVHGGKITMKQNGCFRDIDVALMMHGSSTTTTDVRCMALKTSIVTFHGKASHAAIAPDKGRSALDALLLAFHGVEFLREHVLDDTRMHYAILNGGGPGNVVPAEASGEFTLRSYDTGYVLSLTERLLDIFKGAALMTGTSYEVSELPFLMAKIPVLSLNELLMENARAVHAPTIRPPREKTGSTDFGNVMYEVPGSCIRLAFVPENATSHSQIYLDAGKSNAAHDATRFAAEILAMTTRDLITDPIKLEKVRQEFLMKKKSGQY
jgi:amidohydrolase